MNNTLDTVQSFYDDINDQYTEYILRCVPRYAEMQWAIMHYIPETLNPVNILEIGCGTGNLTKLILQRYPNATLHLVDISEKMIDGCKNEFMDYDKIKFYCNDFRELDSNIPNCDLVLSSISIHHINDDEKKMLFKKLYERLTINGIFCYSDQFSSFEDEIYRKNILQWKNESMKNGSNLKEWKMWMDHQNEHDYHAPLGDQLKWIKDSGFINAECVWRHLLWSVLIAKK